MLYRISLAAPQVADLFSDADSQALHLRDDPEPSNSGEERPIPQLSELRLWALPTTN